MREIEEIFNTEGIYSFQDIQDLFQQGACWETNNQEYRNFTEVIEAKTTVELKPGSEIEGYFSGYNFKSETITAETQTGVRGTVKAVLYFCTDKQIVFF